MIFFNLIPPTEHATQPCHFPCQKYINSLIYDFEICKRVIQKNLDTWTGYLPFALQFLRLYRCDQDSKAKVKNYMDREKPLGVGEARLFSLLDLLGQILHPGGRGSQKNTNRLYGWHILSGFFSELACDIPNISPLGRLRKVKLPPRAVTFGWLALSSGVLMMDNLHQ